MTDFAYRILAKLSWFWPVALVFTAIALFWPVILVIVWAVT